MVGVAIASAADSPTPPCSGSSAPGLRAFRRPCRLQQCLNGGPLLPLMACSARKSVSTVVVASSGKKIDINKQGLNSIQDETVKLNLMGRSKSMESKDWRDSQGRKGKVRRSDESRQARAGAACGAAGRPAAAVDDSFEPRVVL